MGVCELCRLYHLSNNIVFDTILDVLRLLDGPFAS